MSRPRLVKAQQPKQKLNQKQEERGGNSSDLF